MNRQVAAAMLWDLGVEVDVAANGREALDILDMHMDDAPYAAILMDCQMPVMDGFQAARAIRDAEVLTGYHTPIIGLTAYAMEADRDRCILRQLQAMAREGSTQPRLNVVFLISSHFDYDYPKEYERHRPVVDQQGQPQPQALEVRREAPEGLRE